MRTKYRQLYMPRMQPREFNLSALATIKLRHYQVGTWAYTYVPLVLSYNDPPKTLEDLQAAVSNPEPGYDIHHIVEQAQASRDGVCRDIIDAPENVVRIPTMKHWEIN